MPILLETAMKPEEQQTLLQKLANLPSRNLKDAPSVWAQGRALLREMLKDVNDTFQKVFFGQPAGQNEIGTPLVPTQAMVTSDLGVAYAKHARMEDAQQTYQEKL